MLEIKIGDNWTYETYGLNLIAGWELSQPEPKLTSIEIPYSNGSIDLTESLTGETNFNDRNLAFNLLFPKYKRAWNSTYARLVNDLHGKKTTIVLPDRPNYQFSGRMTVGKFETDNTVAKVEISASVYPFRIQAEPTKVSATVPDSGSLTLNLVNERMTTLPTFTISADSQITFNATTYSHIKGTFTLANVFLIQGNNSITIKATAGTKVTITYQEGAL